MSFNSLAFGVFLVVVLPCVHLLPKRAQNGFLVAASYLFYGWWDWRFCGLLLLSTVVDYLAARRIRDGAGPAARKLALAASVVVNLGVLGFFKYFGFFTESATLALEALGLEVHPYTLGIVLPVGISFYTFQTLAYTIDVYRGRIRATDDFVAFMLYVSFFPQLVAGPIERAGRLLPQLEGDRELTPHFLRTGVALIAIGFFKKVGIADGVAPLVDEVYGDAGSFSAVTVFTGVLLFALQLYGDFSGYSDIARGSARLLGVDLMRNFEQPFLSGSWSEFWRRWHVSLSTWFMDYVYIPLGGSKGGELRTSFNLFVVFAVSGLWHGAGWTWVTWGALCGVLLVANRAWDRLPFNRGVTVPRDSVRGIAGAIATTLTFALTLVVFRSTSLAHAWTVFAAMLLSPWFVGFEDVFLTGLVVYGVPVLVLDLWQRISGEEEPMLELAAPLQGLLFGGMLVWILVAGGVDNDVPFVYFQF
ncbi:MAG: MBOAT family protein [Myxococcota bacterium]